MGGKAYRSELTAIGLLAAWFVYFSEYIFTPWVQGVDSLTRLYHIDQTIVVLNYNPWLPGMQLVLRFVHLFFDSAIAYKLATAVVAMVGMYFFFQIINRMLGFWTAVFSFAYFFLNTHWRLVATTPYMEPLLLLTASVSVYYHLNGRPWLSRLFFVFASFSRPEILLGAPWILFGHLLYYRSWRRTFKFGLLFVPIAIYYVALKMILPSFESPHTFSASESFVLFIKLAVVFRNEPVFRFIGVLALLGIWVIARDRSFSPEKRRALGVVGLSLLGFYLTFVFILPLVHDFTAGGTRPTILLALPTCVVAGVGVAFLHERWPGTTITIYLALLIPALATQYFDPEKNLKPYHYVVAEDAHRKLLDLGYETGPLLTCTIDEEQLTGPRVFPVYYRPFYVYLRFRGWEQTPIPCPAGDAGWKERAASDTAPLMRLFDGITLTPEYAEELTEGCRYHTKLETEQGVHASICF